MQYVRKTSYGFGITSFLLVMIKFCHRGRVLCYIKCISNYDWFRIANRQKEHAACYGLGKFSTVANSQPNDIGKQWKQQVHRQGTSKFWLSENARNSPKLKVNFETYIQNYFYQQMHCLLKHKMLQFVLKISLYMAPTCFGPSWTIIREYTIGALLKLQFL